ncbi:DNA-binding protein [Paraburkholderia sp. EG287B]|uniref:DNA-binding protein n=1 Tax=Paraburkholderia sp. EG287B TaxID=3237010 RepID=UPI0034D1ED5E
MKSGNPPNPAFSRHNPEMGRTPLNSPETVHAVVRQLLAAAGVAAPITPSLFRRIVTARRVREDLGGGDPAWIGRQVRAIEVELISESTARYTASGLPDQVADSMRSLWLMALEAARGEFAAAQADAAASVASAAAERDNASALVAMLRAELDDWQKQAREQDVCIGQQREELAQVHRRLAEETDRARRAETALDQAARASDEARRRHEEELSSVRGKYAGLSRQLLNATDQFRQSLAARQAAVQPEVQSLRRRLAQVTENYEKLVQNGEAAATRVPGGSPPPRTQNPPAD